MRAARGFTLIELVITVAILGVLATLALPLLQVTAQRQKEAELRAGLRELRGAIDAYHDIVAEQSKQGGKKRIEVPADSTGYPPDLDTLVKGVTDVGTPDGKKIYFLRRLPRDPFHPDGSVPAAESWGKRSYASPPDEPSEGEDVFDVFSLSQQTGLNGVVYRAW